MADLNMADLNTDLQLYLKLNKINEVKQGSSTQTQVHDFSSHERHGIVKGNPTVISDDRFGSCLSFDGIDDFIDCGNLDFAKGTYTISAWFKSSVSSQIDIFSATEAGTSNHGILVELNDGRLRFLHRNLSPWLTDKS